MNLVSKLGGMLLALAATFLTSDKANVIGYIEAGAGTVEDALIAAIDKGFAGHGVLGLFAVEFKPLVEASVKDLVAQGETHLGTLYDAAVVALNAEAVKLEGAPVPAPSA